MYHTYPFSYSIQFAFFALFFCSFSFLANNAFCLPLVTIFLPLSKHIVQMGKQW